MDQPAKLSPLVSASISIHVSDEHTAETDLSNYGRLGIPFLRLQVSGVSGQVNLGYRTGKSLLYWTGKGLRCRIQTAASATGPAAENYSLQALELGKCAS